VGSRFGAGSQILRYDAPVQTNGRTVHQRFECGGQSLGPGEIVVTLIGGANRDPERFADPDRFNVARTDNQSLTFGGGVHHCLGAGLARIEAQIVMTRLAERFSSLELVDEKLVQRPSLNQHGPEVLPLRFLRRSSTRGCLHRTQ
jgi:cytochrome P450